MKVSDELVQFPWNTVRAKIIGPIITLSQYCTILGMEIQYHKDNDSLEVFKLWKDVHMPEAVNRNHWKILRDRKRRNHPTSYKVIKLFH